MRTVETEVYEWEELSEQAKEVAIGIYRENYIDIGYIWDDGKATVQAFCDVFNVETSNRNWLEPRFGYIDNDILEMSGELLKEYIKENIPDKYLQRDDYPLTGMCYDMNILLPIWDFMDNPSDSVNYEDLITDCFYQIEKVINDDISYEYSDESIIERITTGDYEFTKDGHFYF